MDGSAFRHLSFGWLVPMFVLAALGALTLTAGACFLIYLAVEHLRFV